MWRGGRAEAPAGTGSRCEKRGVCLRLALDALRFRCRWRLGSIQTYNPEQIMLSAAVRRSSRDVNIMKEKLIFSGEVGSPSTASSAHYRALTIAVAKTLT